MATRSKTTPRTAPPVPAPSRKAARPAAPAPAAAGAAVGKKAAADGKARPVAPIQVQPAAKADKAKADKPKKPKLVRDSFTIPKDEYGVLEALKLRAAKLGRPTKKSEVLRAGVRALAAMGDAAFLANVGTVPVIKTGRPAKAASQ